MSTTRKKKTQTEKVDPLTDKGYRVSIDPSLIGRLGRVGRSPLDAALESEDAALAQELKATRVEGILLKHKAKKAKLQKEIDKLEKESEKNEKEDSALPGISIPMARQISMLPTEEQDKILQTYAAFRSIDKSKGRGDSLLPLLIGYSKTNPGTPQINMLDYAKAMGDQLKTGIDLAKAFTTKEKPSNAMEFMKVMKDLVIEGVRNPLMQAIKEAQPTPGVFEQILTQPDLWNRFKEIGLFGGKQGGAGTTEMDLKIAQITTANTLEMKKMDLEWRKSMLERESQDRKTDALLSALTPISMLLSGPLDQKMRQFGQQQASAHNPVGIPPVVIPPVVIPPVVMPPQNAVLIECSCGYEGSITFTGAPPAVVNCPQCGLGLNMGDGPLAGKPEETDTESRD